MLFLLFANCIVVETPTFSQWIRRFPAKIRWRCYPIFAMRKSSILASAHPRGQWRRLKGNSNFHWIILIRIRSPNLNKEVLIVTQQNSSMLGLCVWISHEKKKKNRKYIPAEVMFIFMLNVLIKSSFYTAIISQNQFASLYFYLISFSWNSQ